METPEDMQLQDSSAKILKGFKKREMLKIPNAVRVICTAQSPQSRSAQRQPTYCAWEDRSSRTMEENRLAADWPDVGSMLARLLSPRAPCSAFHRLPQWISPAAQIHTLHAATLLTRKAPESAGPL